MAEFEVVDQAAGLFEKSSGCLLHRDPVAGKCKVLALGRWKNSLQQEDIQFPYMKLSPQLSMVGVELASSWQATRKINCDELKDRVKNTIGSWRSGKHMPLVCRPFSLNSYCLSKVWFRTGSIDLRQGDIQDISSKCKSWCYQDLLQKPSEVILYREVEQGGLGLHHVQSKAMAHLISTFLQTAASSRFIQSLFHNQLYRYHVLDETDLPDPGYTPYYSQSFFNIIKKVKTNTPLNPVHMTTKEWYRFLLEENITMREVDADGRRELVPCRVEEHAPEVSWSESYRLLRLKGLCPEQKSLLFKLVHELLPTKERVSNIIPTTNPACLLCLDNTPETYYHTFFTCSSNKESGEALLRCSKTYAPALTPRSLLKLEIVGDDPFLLPTMLLIATGLQLIWKNRQLKKVTSTWSMRSELEARISLLRRTRKKKLVEAGAILENMITNFYF